SKILDVLKTEYKWENILLAILASLALAFSLMIINGTLEVRENFPLIGKYPMLFAWILFSISIIGIILVIYPFFVQALPELKKISWANWAVSLDAIAKVFIFVIIFAMLFVGFDALIQLVIGRL
ncbi:MAG: preprotein translocase subunit SecE, partial [Acholeplasmataceae bacterium]|nr:preprotein translocase subunit SecE [Acholeplasmataceae bacterium]